MNTVRAIIVGLAILTCIDRVLADDWPAISWSRFLSDSFPCDSPADHVAPPPTPLRRHGACPRRHGARWRAGASTLNASSRGTEMEMLSE